MGWAGSEVSCFPFPSTNTQHHQLTHMHSRAHTTHARAHTITLHLPSLHTYQAYSHFCVSHSHAILSLVLPRGHAHSRKLVVVCVLVSSPSSNRAPKAFCRCSFCPDRYFFSFAFHVFLLASSLCRRLLHTTPKVRPVPWTLHVPFPLDLTSHFNDKSS